MLEYFFLALPAGDLFAFCAMRKIGYVMRHSLPQHHNSTSQFRRKRYIRQHAPRSLHGMRGRILHRISGSGIVQGFLFLPLTASHSKIIM
jgi:hypothetical protein